MNKKPNVRSTYTDSLAQVAFELGWFHINTPSNVSQGLEDENSQKQKNHSGQVQVQTNNGLCKKIKLCKI